MVIEALSNMSDSTAIPLSSDQAKQNLVESLRFGDGSTFKEIPYGIMASESAADAKIDLRDKLTGARLCLVLRTQHAALAVIGKRNKAVFAKYGF